MDVGPLFVAHAQAAELVQPGERPLHDPAPAAQSTAMFSVALRKKRDDVAGQNSQALRFGQSEQLAEAES